MSALYTKSNNKMYPCSRCGVRKARQYAGSFTCRDCQNVESMIAAIESGRLVIEDDEPPAPVEVGAGGHVLHHRGARRTGRPQSTEVA